MASGAACQPLVARLWLRTVDRSASAGEGSDQEWTGCHAQVLSCASQAWICARQMMSSPWWVAMMR